MNSGGLRGHLAAHRAADDETAATTETDPDGSADAAGQQPPSGTDGDAESDADADLVDPFSQSFDLSEWDVDSQAVDRGLSLLVAATNLL